MNISLFVDGSVNQVQQIAFGAMWHTCSELSEHLSSIASELIFINFCSKKSTFVEISTAIFAIQWLKERYSNISSLTLYTDCQSLVDLIHRRKEKLIANNFSTKSGKFLGNRDLYIELFQTIQDVNIAIVKVKGHIRNPETAIEKIFATVDQELRKKLRSSQK